jgi:NADPH2:quinone reductase
MRESEMKAQAIRIHETGGPEVLRWEEIEVPAPGPGEVTLRNHACGLNFIDTYQRSGLYPMKYPCTLGQEGAGTVTAVCDGVVGFAPGDRVAWTGVLGSYAEKHVIPASAAVHIPEGVEFDLAAAVMLQGLTAHYLTHDTFAVGTGHRCLVHAGAGGVGLLLIQIAKHRGAEVFTTVGNADKVELARGAGADHVIEYHGYDFAAAVEAIAGPKALHVVYDGVGKAVFEASLGLLRRRGMMVTFGNASGAVEPIAPLRLAPGSLFLTRPTLGDYIAERAELERRAADLFGWIADGWLQVRVGHRLPLVDAAEAHRQLEGRRTTGKILLIP